MMHRWYQNTTRARRHGSLATALLIACFIAAAPASAGLIKSYDFDGDLTDSLGNGAPLQCVVAGCESGIGGGRYAFSSGEGLLLDNPALPSTTDYRIDIKFQVIDIDGNSGKLIDFESRSDDSGVYIVGQPFGLEFYIAVPLPASSGPAGSVPYGQDVIMTLTRNGATDEVKGFLNGVEQWSFLDVEDDAVASLNELYIFIDDVLFGSGENFEGEADYIRIYDSSAVPEPAILVLMGLGLAGLGFAGRRRPNV